MSGGGGATIIDLFRAASASFGDDDVGEDDRWQSDAATWDAARRRRYASFCRRLSHLRFEPRETTIYEDSMMLALFSFHTQAPHYFTYDKPLTTNGYDDDERFTSMSPNIEAIADGIGRADPLALSIVRNLLRHYKLTLLGALALG